MNPPLFVPFNIRNAIMNESGKGFDNNPDITKISYEKQYQILLSYMPEKKIIKGIQKRFNDRVRTALQRNQPMTFDDLQAWIKGHPNKPMVAGASQRALMIQGSLHRAVAGFDKTSGKAYWKFNEASGDILNQATSGNGWDDGLGTAADLQTTGVIYGGTGIIGDALQWDSTDDTALAGTSKSQFNFMHDTGSLFTLNTWFKTDDATDTADLLVILADHGGGSTSAGISVFREDRGGASFDFELRIGGSGGFLIVAQITDYFPENTDWHMMTVRWDEAAGSGNCLIRINDGTDSSINKSGTPVDGDSTDEMSIGNLQVAPNFAWGGLQDEMSIFNRLFSEAEIEDVYNGGSGLEL